MDMHFESVTMLATSPTTSAIYKLQAGRRFQVERLLTISIAPDMWKDIVLQKSAYMGQAEDR